MKQKLTAATVFLFCFFLLACGGKKESASSLAQKWCDLNAKAYKAAEGPEKEAAEMARDKFEKEMEEKYKDKKDFMAEVEKEVEKCEGASEGRK
jgi:esterase/lipase